MTGNWLNDILGGKAAAQGGTDPLRIQSAGGEPRETAPASPQAVQLDTWGMRRGRDVLEGSKALRELLSDETEQARSEAADLHGMCFEYDPVLNAACEDAQRLEYLKAVANQADYQALHASTAANEIASEIATIHLAQGLSRLRQEKPPRKDGKPYEQERQQARAALAAQRAAGTAAAAAREEVEAIEEQAQAFGFSLAGGSGPGGTIDRNRLKTIFNHVRNSHSLKHILDLAGRYRRVARAMQQTKVTHGMDELVGVTLDGEVQRLLPQELALLDDPDLELDALIRLTEKRSLCWQMKGVEKQAKGPIMVFVDESGSMGEHDRIFHAKALALTMAWLARQQKRWCCLVGFSTRHHHLVLPPGAWNELALMQWLEAFERRDTDIPLDRLEWFFQQTGADRGKTDVLVITDGVWSAPAGFIEPVQKWLADNKARLIALSIGDNAGDLVQLTKEVHLIGGLSPESTAAQSALSI